MVVLKDIEKRTDQMSILWLTPCRQAVTLCFSLSVRLSENAGPSIYPTMHRINCPIQRVGSRESDYTVVGSGGLLLVPDADCREM